MRRLRVSSALAPITTLGPSPAAAIWVQGCALACSGCASAHTWDPDAGAGAEVEDVATWLERTGLRRLTISGGEPMDQAPALAVLLDRLRRQGDWIVTAYSGHRIEELRQDLRPGTAALVERLDVLIDGRFLVERHARLLWRGSTNQRIHDLTGRVEMPPDRSVGVTPVVHADGSFALVGVYPEPDLADRLAIALGTEAEPLTEVRTPAYLPFPTTKEP